MQKNNRAFSIVLFVLGGLCIFYYFFLSFLYGFFQISFAYFFLVCGGFCLLFAFYERYPHVSLFRFFPKFIKKLFYLGLSIGLLSFLLIEGLIVYYGKSQVYQEVDTVIILGAGLNKDQISESLRYRLDEAVSYYQVYPDVTFIVSGGQGYNETVSEASAMAKYLIEQGVNEDQILLEDASTSTYENFSFSKQYISETTSVGVITNSFHMYRSLTLAKQQGYDSLVPIPAKSQGPTYLCFCVREYFAILKAWLFHT